MSLPSKLLSYTPVFVSGAERHQPAHGGDPSPLYYCTSLLPSVLLTPPYHQVRSSISELMEEIPRRVVSSQRLSTLRLVMRQQEAATESLRFKQQAPARIERSNRKLE